MGKELGKCIVYALEKMHGEIDLEEFIAPRLKGKGLFEYIIAVMLSQNTSDKNALRAYRSLRELVGNTITPEKILQKEFNEIAEAIKPAGMHFQRTKRIIELAKIFRNKGFTDNIINAINAMDVEEARKLLTSLPGVGVKTADVILLMYFNKPTFPIDTHIYRITRRLGLLSKYDYESIRRFWMNIIDPKEYLKVHLLLITHGRRLCRSRNPLCSNCMLSRLCKYYNQGI